MIIKNEIESVPLFPVCENTSTWKMTGVSGGVVQLPRSGKVLIIDINSADGKFMCRFASDGNSYITSFEWPAKNWTRRNPAHYLREYSANSSEDFDKVVRHFFGSKSDYGNAFDEMNNFVFFKSAKRRDKARQAEFDLRNKHFKMYPNLPGNLDEYCGERVFGHTYVFISQIQKGRLRNAVCAHCGHQYNIAAEVKPNQSGICPKCGAKAIYKANWQKEPFDEGKICICDRVDKQLLIRWTDVYRTYHGFKEKYEYFDYAYNLHLNDGADVYFYKYYRAPYTYDFEWHRGKNGDICYDATKVYAGNLREVFGSDYYGVDLQEEFEARNQTVKMAKLLFNLEKEPASKYLLKLGMLPLAADADLIHYDRHAKNPTFTSVMGISRQLIPLYRDYGVSASEHRIIKEYGGWVSPEDLVAFRKFNITYDYEAVRELLTHMTFGKLVYYLSKQKTLHKKSSYSRIAIEFRDYLEMSEALKVDMSHKSVRFPSDIVAAHAAIVVRYNAVKHEAENNLFVEKVKSLYEHLPETYSKNGFCVVLPQLRSDLIMEGQSLNHCVGGERYYKNHIAGTKMIFFIRKSAEPEKPFFTMELDMAEYRICQLYGFGDCSAPKEVRSFAESYVKLIAPKARKTA